MGVPEIPGVDDLELIASGANGTVWSGVEPDLDRKVAVKVLRSGDNTNERRFSRERKAMGRLSGIAGVVPIHRAGVTERGELFLVMPLYRQSLQDVLTETGAIPWERVVDMLSRVADAITQAHHLGVLHLDLKPSNLLLNDRGEAFVADFGIAELMDSTASLSGAMLTPNYAAPERFIDNTPTQAADVYGLGATMYAALVGAPPFPTEKNTGPAVVMQKVLNEPVDLSKLPGDLPARLRALVDASMAKNPDERPGSAEQFALELSHDDGSTCLLYTSPSPRDATLSRMPSSA